MENISINVPKSEWESVLAKLSLLEKVANKQKLARFATSEKVGQSVRLNLYAKDTTSEPKVILSWKMIRNVSRPGLDEDQVIELTLDNCLDSKNRQGYVMQKARLEKQLSQPDVNKEEITTKIKEVEDKMNATEYETIEMDYANFYKSIEQVPVTVKETRTDSNTGKVSFIVDYKGKEYKIGADFVN